MELDITLLAILAAIAFFAGFIHSAIGFGFGIVAIALLPFFIDGRSAHVVVSVSSIPMLLMAGWAYRDGVDWKSLRPALLGAAFFLPLGFAVFELLPLDWLVRGTGLGILGMVWMSLRKHESGSMTEKQWIPCFIAGATGGFLAGAVSIAGPPIAAFGLKQEWPQHRFKAFITQCLIIIALYKVGLLFFRGHVNFDSGLTILTIAILSIAGVQAGALASRRISPNGFKGIVAFALVSVSFLMILRGQPKEENTPETADSRQALTLLDRQPNSHPESR